MHIEKLTSLNNDFNEVMSIYYNWWGLKKNVFRKNA